MKPIVQLAIDVVENTRAAEIAAYAVEAGADWLEIGNPLNKFEGVHAIDYISSRFPNEYILVDFMVIAGAKRYVTAAKDRGAKNVTVTALAPDITVRETIEEGKKQGIAITVDLFNVSDIVSAAIKYEKMGADYIMVHFGVDQKRENPNASPLEALDKIAKATKVPLSFAVYDIEEAMQAVKLGAEVIVVGEPLISSETPVKDMKEFIQKLKTLDVVKR